MHADYSFKYHTSVILQIRMVNKSNKTSSLEQNSNILTQVTDGSINPLHRNKHRNYGKTIRIIFKLGTQTKLKIEPQLQEWIIPADSRQKLFTWYFSGTTREIYHRKDDIFERLFATQKTPIVMKINVSSKDNFGLLPKDSISITQITMVTFRNKSNQSYKQ